MMTDKPSKSPGVKIEQEERTPPLAAPPPFASPPAVVQDMPWYDAVEVIRPHVVRISTPRSTGTGFLLTNSKVDALCSIATAAHVINHAHYWEEPIRVEHVHSGKTQLIRNDDRAVFLDHQRDTAAMLFDRGELPLPSDALSLTERGKYLRVGNDIGWLGFPAISTELCFFGGRISAWLQDDSAYLVDGVMINGVSGGPAFALLGDSLMIIGVVTNYVPNRATGEVLPGLGVVRHVVQFHDLVPRFTSLDQAQAQQTPPSAPSPNPSTPPDETPTKRST